MGQQPHPGMSLPHLGGAEGKLPHPGMAQKRPKTDKKAVLWRAPNFVLSPLRLSGVKKGTFSTPESTPEYISIVDEICT